MGEVEGFARPWPCRLLLHTSWAEKCALVAWLGDEGEWLESQLDGRVPLTLLRSLATAFWARQCWVAKRQETRGS